MIKLIRNFINTHTKVDRLTLARYFKTSKMFNNKFISRSKSKYMDIISNLMISNTLADFNPLIIEYLRDNDYFRNVENSIISKISFTCTDTSNYTKSGKINILLDLL